MRDPARKRLWSDAERGALARNIADESEAEELPESYKFSRSRNAMILIPKDNPALANLIIGLLEDAILEWRAEYDRRPLASADKRTRDRWAWHFGLILDDRCGRIRSKIKPRRGS
jgi:hypothetical protein